MLKLNKVKKSYKTGSFVQQALKDINLEFRENEFVAALGPSGSGKTTLLNIIGGLDNYDSGDLIINGKSTKNFKASDWDAYRNNSVGFIFQSYNLIPHISILDNVEMGMTLSGVSARQRKVQAKELLKKVGLADHIHKKPNQLSGGQMQRVAIARALANDPDIILADEPTGALDSKTSEQIMDLIKKIAKEKLVIMVTHNPDLANKYATRIIEMKDGEVTHDSKPLNEKEKKNGSFSLKKTSMSFLTALKLSFNNIKTNKGRTALTAFASSIGIIGIALILSLSNGFNIEVENFEQNSLAQSPIIIANQAMQVDEETMLKLQGHDDLEKYSDKKRVYAQDDVVDTMLHNNKITNDYIDYIEKMDMSKISGYSYEKGTSINLVTQNSDGKYNLLSMDNNSDVQLWTILPINPNDDEGVIEENYDVLAGSLDNDEPGIILQVNNRNQISASTLKQLGFGDEEVSFDDIMDKEFKIILNDDYYQKIGNTFIPSQDYEKMYNSDNSITVKVTAIIRGKEDKEVVANSSGLAYTNSLVDLVISSNKNSAIVKAQEQVDYNILTNQVFDDETNSTNTKDMMMGYLGADTLPIAIYIYPKDFDTKDYITDYLDDYNNGKDEEDMVQYTDMADMISSLTGSIMDAITVVLIAFSSISLVVSSIMIGIITYISVLERTKEIGILRALGARKKDIKRVFNAETFIIGMFSGLLGIAIAYILTIPTNMIIENLSGLANVAKLNPFHALILILISLILTIIGGAIPASMASKKDPVEALRTE